MTFCGRPELGGLHVVLVKLLDHGGTHDARHLTGERNRQRNRGHDHARHVAAEVRRRIGQGTRGGKQVHERGEHQDEEDCQPKRRRRKSRDGDYSNHLIRPTVAIQGRDDAQQERYDGSYQQAEERQLHGDGQSLGDTVGNRIATGAVGAQIAVKQVAQITDVTDWPGIIQTIFLVVFLNLLLRGRLTQRLVGRIDRRERHEEEDQKRHGNRHERKRHQTSSHES